MDLSVKKLFDAIAIDYDLQRKQLIPCFEEFYGVALSVVECNNPCPNILDLGAGTGLFSGMVYQKYPNSRFTLVDLSEKMLEGARKRFHQLDNFQYVVADYSNLTFSQSYDIVISSLSIHHLTHIAKKQLFSKIYELLNVGGIFVNADQVKGNDSMTDHYFKQRWIEHINKSGLTQESIDASIERRKLDINANLGDQIKWMEQAGFQAVDCMYKYFDFGVFFGKK
ncbi:class I SAM-dependent methyltransferase [Paenibacillus sp. NFR01]|uniref:class I SAM-dependent methyltransferase n=1 Tax=Paenibacillus sp. NFR01 TaxID=1566279 RepID=UPI0008B39931|nr:class I SAM-dependent methyltransferase [Paenibacillus sp. NFR01]SET27023.1 tRNA (cmo5U34)-methyltransferase [Paenibacillus sp. NFR01]